MIIVPTARKDTLSIIVTKVYPNIHEYKNNSPFTFVRLFFRDRGRPLVVGRLEHSEMRCLLNKPIEILILTIVSILYRIMRTKDELNLRRI
jgi:hypothetical protein